MANRVSKFSNILCGGPQGSTLSPLLFLIYVNDMSEAVECDLYLYVDDSCLFFQHMNITEIKTKVNERLQQYLSLVCRYKFLNIHFEEDKRKSIFFSFKCNLKLVEELHIRYKDIKLKQHKHVNYLLC